MSTSNTAGQKIFLLTPLREGRHEALRGSALWYLFLLTPLREGRRMKKEAHTMNEKFLLTPLREGRRYCCSILKEQGDFYSRPCGRGDLFSGLYGIVT